MSEKLYGAKCIRCGCIDHHGSEGLEADPIPWLEQRGMECARCTFCQERALSRAIQEAGLFIFAPEVREAVEMFKRGDTSHPITQSLRAECLAIEAEAESGTPEAILSAEEWERAMFAAKVNERSDAATALRFHDRALRGEVARLTRERENVQWFLDDAINTRMHWYVTATQQLELSQYHEDRAEAAEARVAVLTEALRDVCAVAEAGLSVFGGEVRKRNERRITAARAVLGGAETP